MTPIPEQWDPPLPCSMTPGSASGEAGLYSRRVDSLREPEHGSSNADDYRQCALNPQAPSLVSSHDTIPLRIVLKLDSRLENSSLELAVSCTANKRR